VWPADPIEAIDAVLAHLAADPGGFAILTLDARRNYYVQVATSELGLIAEAVGNVHLKPDDALGANEQAALEGLGWIPNGDGSENWSMVFDGWPTGGSDRVADVLLRAMTTIYGWRTTDGLAIRTGR
jgi:hypothetical protein